MSQKQAKLQRRAVQKQYRLICRNFLTAAKGMPFRERLKFGLSIIFAVGVK